MAAQQLLAQSASNAGPSLASASATLSVQSGGSAPLCGELSTGKESFRPFKRRILERSSTVEGQGSDASNSSVSEAYNAHLCPAQLAL